MKHELFNGKTIDDAINKAIVELRIASDQLEYVVVDKGSSGILGIGSRPAVIEAWAKDSIMGAAQEFLDNVFRTMNMDVEVLGEYNEEERVLSLDLQGEDMGILIGKRGQTLDSLQYLTSLVVNKASSDYIRVKLDIENYRERREDSLENLARSCAAKVKKSKKPIVLEPMNPYERRIIHSCLQSDRNVITSSEGEEPYRHVVISLRRGGGKKNDRKEENFED
ncbi:MAG: protein jag [Lachnospiraceae bacterium]|nr:protein jag [Lachnospiraceae bacterium]